MFFLPGVAEIQRTIDLLTIKETEILPLYGDLPSTKQDKAILQPNDNRHIIHATSIAETSLTVPGVCIVIDGGFRRTAHFNGDTGFSCLLTQRISKTATKQRARRSGRERDGVVYRLWTKTMERSFALHDQPEILFSELSSFLLIYQS